MSDGTSRPGTRTSPRGCGTATRRRSHPTVSRLQEDDRLARIPHDLILGRAAEPGEEPVQPGPTEQVVARRVVVDSGGRQDVRAVQPPGLAAQVADADVVAQVTP